MRPRRLAVILLVLALLVVTVHAQRTPMEDPARDVRNSECFDCHVQGGGGLGPPLVQMFTLRTTDGLPEAGEAADINVVMRNVWTAELRDIEAVMDLSNAPSLGFAGDMDPVDESHPVTVPRADLLQASPNVQQPFFVPAATTDLLLRLVPDTQDGPLAPVLILSLWPPGADPDGPAPITIDDGGPGATQTFQARGSRAIADLGSGNWTAGISQRTLPDSGVAGLTEPGATLRMQAWGNVTGDRQEFRSHDGVLDGQQPETPQNASFTWRIVAESPPVPGETVTVTATTTAFYRHPPGITQWNQWGFIRSFDLQPVLPPAPGQPPPPLPPPSGTEPEGEEVPEAPPPGIGWDRIGETIGYLAAFLLVVSKLTGGVFGKASRRAINKLFRSARHRIAFHNFTSYFLTIFAVVHTVIFLLEPAYPWTLGILWGGLALVAMMLLGVTGALQVPMVRRWSYSSWRWIHFTLAMAAFLFTIAHLLLDGANFGWFQELVGWQDPFVR